MGPVSYSPLLILARCAQLTGEQDDLIKSIKFRGFLGLLYKKGWIIVVVGPFHVLSQSFFTLAKSAYILLGPLCLDIPYMVAGIKIRTIM